MSEARCTIAIVTYNSMDTLPGTLDAAKRCFDAGLAKTVIVDNVSGDGTADFAEEHHPWATVIRSPGNLGFGRGCNLAFEEVATEYVLFLNPDAAIQPQDLKLLIDFMDDEPNAGVAAPAANMPDGGRHHFQQTLTSPWHVIVDATLPRLGKNRTGVLIPGSAPFKTEWVPGAALLFRSQLFRDLGGFDPRFFLYFEETDLLRRVSDAGYAVWAVPEAVIDHVGGGSTKKTGDHLFMHCIAEHYFQSRMYYLSKHHGRPLALLAEGVELGAYAAKEATARLFGRGPGVLGERLKGPLFSFPPRRD